MFLRPFLFLSFLVFPASIDMIIIQWRLVPR